MRFWEGWCGRKAWCAFKRVVGVTVFGTMGGNPSGSRPNFFGRQHLTFDKGGKCDSVFRGIVRFWEGWTGRKGGGAFEMAGRGARVAVLLRGLWVVGR